MRTGTSKEKLAKFQRQKREKAERARAVPEEPPPRAATTVVTCELPNTLFMAMQKVKLGLQNTTEDRKTYNVSMITRAALSDFLGLEMDDQIELVRRYVAAQARASEQCDAS